MSHEELPPELRELEAALAARPMPIMDPTHRASVTSAMRREQAARNAPRSFWRFAAGAAAALFLGINLSMSAANDTNLRVGMRSDEHETQAALAQIHEALPELSDEDAQRHVLLLRGRAQLVSVPQLHGSTRFQQATEEN